MKEEKDRLSKSFKEKLGDYSHLVSNSLWINIQADIRRSKMLRLRYYYMSAASVVVLLGLLTGILVLLEAPVSRVSPMTLKNAMAVDNSTISVVDPKQTQADELGVLVDNKRLCIIELKEKSSKPNVELISTIIKDPSPSDTYFKKEPTTEKTQGNKTPTKKKNLGQEAPMVREYLWDIGQEMPPKAKSSRKLKLSFMGAGAFAESKSSISKGMLSIDMLGDISQSSLPDQSLSPAMMNYRTNYMDYGYRYGVPFSFGVFLRKDLPKGFSLETGVFATMLSTTFLLRAESDKNVGSNTMWYVGVPIKASWNIFSTDIWSLYVSAGGAIEKCISSQYSGEKLYFQDLTIESSADILARDFAFQFSVNAAIGLQIKLAKAIGLFFEPGVSYFFDAKTPIPTTRANRPFNLNLQVGVRFSL